ncbi:unnamed protein product [Macrosiphum euphorbiae]|uniref:Uncharacterized protein n=1 Tax=Macrosiphum euphorbiae TaxID=13131 RepID=A0AAV0X3C1_9HEMI|nr:unnamed protein product [Macrosiphum euphorbiae]
MRYNNNVIAADGILWLSGDQRSCSLQLYAAGDRRTRGRGRSSYRRQCFDVRRQRRSAAGRFSHRGGARSESEITAITGGHGLHGPPRRVNGSLASRRTASTSREIL